MSSEDVTAQTLSHSCLIVPYCPLKCWCPNLLSGSERNAGDHSFFAWLLFCGMTTAS